MKLMVDYLILGKTFTMDFKSLSDNSRVWIYQSSKEFTKEESKEIEDHGESFIRDWAAHGSSLSAAFKVFYYRFIVLFADESEIKASGCSIDSSVHFIQKIQNAYQTDLFDRLNIAFKVNGEIDVLRMNDFQTALDNNRLTERTIVFNNLVETKKDFIENWEVELRNSWHKQLLTN